MDIPAINLEQDKAAAQEAIRAFEAPPAKVFLFRDLSGRGITNELTEQHIRDQWDIESEDESGMLLADYLSEAEVGAEWTGDQDNLVRIK